MPDTFSIAREISRREVERHKKRFTGITVNTPEHREIGGKLEWVCDVRVGWRNTWEVIKDVTVAQWAQGIVTDMNVPVLCERNEAGQVTIIGRSEIHLPNISHITYSYNELGLLFMTNLTQSGNAWYDGFGYEMPDPEAESGATTNYTFIAQRISWDSADFKYGVTSLDAASYKWSES